MDWLTNLLLVIQVASAVAIIVLVLLQQGKGADLGAAFGSGSAGSVFGASGSANFLSRSTALLAVVFFSSTLALSYMGSRDLRASSSGGGIMESIPGSVPGAVSPELPPVPVAPKENAPAK
nr:Protein-export membrane protein SecG [Cupriavidus sp.]